MAESLPSSGPIDPKSFPFTLVGFLRNGATGSLKVEGENHLKALYFRGGRVLFGSSNDPKDQLGAILIGSGKITEQQLEDVNQKVGPGNPLAKVLTESGIVSQRELSEAARAKVERILSDVLSYADGKFEFEDGVLPKGAVDLKLSPERLFMAAVRRVSDRAFVLRHIDGLDVVLSTRPELQEKLPEIESELAGLPDHFDGLVSLKEAAGRAALDEFEAAKIACALLFLGLAEKSPVVVVGGGEASPFFVPSEEGSELDLGQSGAPSFMAEEPQPTIAIGGVSEEAEAPIVVDSETLSTGDPEATMVMGEMPSFSLPNLSSPPEPAFTPVVASPPPAPELAGVPDQTAPLRIIAPPKPAERSRPPSKPSRDDLAALDELLGKRSPEGPLTPIHKPAEEWKPTFLPEQTSRGRKRRDDSKRKLLVGVGTGFVFLAAAAAGWVIWSNRAIGAAGKAVASPSAAPMASPSISVAAASPTPTASVSSVPPAPTPSASPVAASTKPAAVPTATASATALPVPTATPKAVPTAAAKAAPAATPKPSGTSGGLDEARSLLRKGRFDDAARSFQSHLKSSKATHSVQILLACSPETVEKAASAVQASDLYVLPVHYKGKNCYRLGWGLYDSEAKANAGARAVPEYFRQGGARPKVVPLAELLP